MEQLGTTASAGQIQEPMEMQSAYHLIEPLLQNGQRPEAIAHLLTLAERFPDSARIQNDLGVLYYQSGDPEKAFEHYRKAVAMDPENTTFQRNLADFYWVERGDIEEALVLYNQILAKHPNDLETLQALGYLCLSLEKDEDAAFFFNRMLEIEPWNTTAWKALEALTVPASKPALSEGEEASRLFEEVKKCLEAGEKEEAVQILEAIRRRYPENALVFNDLGVLHYHLGNKPKALYYYQKAVRLKPDEASFKKNLADFYLVELDEIEEALKLYLEVLEKNPEDMETLFALGHVCIRLGKREDARFFYNRILDIEPWNVNAQEMLDALGEE
jgi:Flp pilus assembly protein TadD